MPGGAIDWSAPGSGGARQLWRMNLHYMEYLEGCDDDTWLRIVRDWIAANPAGQRGAWRDSWNSYALSLRLVVWLQELARRAGSFPAQNVQAIEASAVTQLRYLVGNLETDLGGNHLIKNIKALLLAAAYFDGAEPRAWRRLGIEHLQRELARQVLADGVHFELSPSYHCQVFADLIECRQALGEDPLVGTIDVALHKMAQAIADLTHPDGGVAQFNDAGLSMAYTPSACLDAYRQQTGRWISPNSVFAYEQAGYFGLRSDAGYFVADCGRIGPDDLPAHGQSDVLSFEWSIAGRRLVVDQGVFEYVDGVKRQMARSAACHNTLSIDGADQADFFGAFRCGRRPNVALRRWEPRAGGFTLEGAHDGFAHLQGAPRHVRRFDVDAREVRILDRLETARGTAPGVSASIGFLLHPDAQVVIDGKTAHLTLASARIEMEASAPIGCEPAVWWPDMGCEQATSRIRIVLPPGSNEIVTIFKVQTSGTPQ